jgi:predicted RNA-binding protein with PIN domain
MSLLIDGYNLLHATGIIGRGIGPGGLERSRMALLGFLAASIEPDELPRTTVVFDAQDAPRGLPRTIRHRGLTVRFAAQRQSADELIEELILADSAPRRMVVVSSDRRIQRAARRRRAKAVASDLWYAEVIRRRRLRMEQASESPDRPPVPLLEEDVNYWIRQFGLEDQSEQKSASEADIYNPFPEGYGRELEG